MTKSRRMRVAGRVACMGEKKNEHRVSVGNSEVRDQLENLSIDGRMILKWIKELRQHVWTDPVSGMLWKLGQIRVPSRYNEISTSRKKEPRMHIKEDIWIVILRPKRTTKPKSSRARLSSSSSSSSSSPS
jgi:hypothetical protein